jgi:hypothetical protein
MSPARATAGCIVLVVLLGIAFWAKKDMEDAPPSRKVRILAEQMRALGGGHSVTPEQIAQAEREMERVLAELQREVGRKLEGLDGTPPARTPTPPAPEKPTTARAKRPLTAPPPAAGAAEAPPPAPDFADAAVPLRPAADATPRVAFVTSGGEYLVLDDGATFRVGEASRADSVRWKAGQEVASLGERLFREDGARLEVRRVLASAGRSVATVDARGALVTLDDGSAWSVDVADRAEVASWEPSGRVVALSGELLHATRSSRVSAQRVR